MSTNPSNTAAPATPSVRKELNVIEGPNASASQRPPTAPQPHFTPLRSGQYSAVAAASLGENNASPNKPNGGHAFGGSASQSGAIGGTSSLSSTGNGSARAGSMPMPQLPPAALPRTTTSSTPASANARTPAVVRFEGGNGGNSAASYSSGRDTPNGRSQQQQQQQQRVGFGFSGFVESTTVLPSAEVPDSPQHAPVDAAGAGFYNDTYRGDSSPSADSVESLVEELRNMRGRTYDPYSHNASPSPMRGQLSMRGPSINPRADSVNVLAAQLRANHNNYNNPSGASGVEDGGNNGYYSGAGSPNRPSRYRRSYRSSYMAAVGQYNRSRRGIGSDAEGGGGGDCEGDGEHNYDGGAGTDLEATAAGMDLLAAMELDRMETTKQQAAQAKISTKMAAELKRHRNRYALGKAELSLMQQERERLLRELAILNEEINSRQTPQIIGGGNGSQQQQHSGGGDKGGDGAANLMMLSAYEEGGTMGGGAAAAGAVAHHSRTVSGADGTSAFEWPLAATPRQSTGGLHLSRSAAMRSSRREQRLAASRQGSISVSRRSGAYSPIVIISNASGANNNGNNSPQTNPLTFTGGSAGNSLRSSMAFAGPPSGIGMNATGRAGGAATPTSPYDNALQRLVPLHSQHRTPRAALSGTSRRRQQPRDRDATSLGGGGGGAPSSFATADGTGNTFDAAGAPSSSASQQAAGGGMSIVTDSAAEANFSATQTPLAPHRSGGAKATSSSQGGAVTAASAAAATPSSTSATSALLLARQQELAKREVMLQQAEERVRRREGAVAAAERQLVEHHEAMRRAGAAREAAFVELDAEARRQRAAVTAVGAALRRRQEASSAPAELTEEEASLLAVCDEAAVTQSRYDAARQRAAEAQAAARAEHAMAARAEEEAIVRATTSQQQEGRASSAMRGEEALVGSGNRGRSTGDGFVDKQRGIGSQHAAFGEDEDGSPNVQRPIVVGGGSDDGGDAAIHSGSDVTASAASRRVDYGRRDKSASVMRASLFASGNAEALNNGGDGATDVGGGGRLFGSGGAPAVDADGVDPATYNVTVGRAAKGSWAKSDSAKLKAQRRAAEAEGREEITHEEESDVDGAHTNTNNTTEGAADDKKAKANLRESIFIPEQPPALPTNNDRYAGYTEVRVLEGYRINRFAFGGNTEGEDSNAAFGASETDPFSAHRLGAPGGGQRGKETTLFDAEAAGISTGVIDGVPFAPSDAVDAMYLSDMPPPLQHIYRQSLRVGASPMYRRTLARGTLARGGGTLRAGAGGDPTEEVEADSADGFRAALSKAIKAADEAAAANGGIPPASSGSDTDGPAANTGVAPRPPRAAVSMRASRYHRSLSEEMFAATPPPEEEEPRRCDPVEEAEDLEAFYRFLEAEAMGSEPEQSASAVGGGPHSSASSPPPFAPANVISTAVGSAASSTHLGPAPSSGPTSAANSQRRGSGLPPLGSDGDAEVVTKTGSAYGAWRQPSASAEDPHHRSASAGSTATAEGSGNDAALPPAAIVGRAVPLSAAAIGVGAVRTVLVESREMGTSTDSAVVVLTRAEVAAKDEDHRRELEALALEAAALAAEAEALAVSVVSADQVAQRRASGFGSQLFGVAAVSVSSAASPDARAPPAKEVETSSANSSEHQKVASAAAAAAAPSLSAAQEDSIRQRLMLELIEAEIIPPAYTAHLSVSPRRCKSNVSSAASARRHNNNNIAASVERTTADEESGAVPPSGLVGRLNLQAVKGDEPNGNANANAASDSDADDSNNHNNNNNNPNGRAPLVYASADNSPFGDDDVYLEGNPFLSNGQPSPKRPLHTSADIFASLIAARDEREAKRRANEEDAAADAKRKKRSARGGIGSARDFTSDCSDGSGSGTDDASRSSSVAVVADAAANSNSNGGTAQNSGTIAPLAAAAMTAAGGARHQQNQLEEATANGGDVTVGGGAASIIFHEVPMVNTISSDDEGPFSGGASRALSNAGSPSRGLNIKGGAEERSHAHSYHNAKSGGGAVRGISMAESIGADCDQLSGGPAGGQQAHPAAPSVLEADADEGIYHHHTADGNANVFCPADPSTAVLIDSTDGWAAAVAAASAYAAASSAADPQTRRDVDAAHNLRRLNSGGAIAHHRSATLSRGDFLGGAGTHPLSRIGSSSNNTNNTNYAGGGHSSPISPMGNTDREADEAASSGAEGEESSSSEAGASRSGAPRAAKTRSNADLASLSGSQQQQQQQQQRGSSDDADDDVFAAVSASSVPFVVPNEAVRSSRRHTERERITMEEEATTAVTKAQDAKGVLRSGGANTNEKDKGEETVRIDPSTVASTARDTAQMDRAALVAVLAAVRGQLSAAVAEGALQRGRADRFAGQLSTKASHISHLSSLLDQTQRRATDVAGIAELMAVGGGVGGDAASSAAAVRAAKLLASADAVVTKSQPVADPANVTTNGVRGLEEEVEEESPPPSHVAPAVAADLHQDYMEDDHGADDYLDEDVDYLSASAAIGAGAAGNNNCSNTTAAENISRSNNGDDGSVCTPVASMTVKSHHHGGTASASATVLSLQSQSLLSARLANMPITADAITPTMAQRRAGRDQRQQREREQRVAAGVSRSRPNDHHSPAEEDGGSAAVLASGAVIEGGGGAASSSDAAEGTNASPLAAAAESLDRSEEPSVGLPLPQCSVARPTTLFVDPSAVNEGNGIYNGGEEPLAADGAGCATNDDGKLLFDDGEEHRHDDDGLGASEDGAAEERDEEDDDTEEGAARLQQTLLAAAISARRSVSTGRGFVDGPRSTAMLGNPSAHHHQQPTSASLGGAGENGGDPLDMDDCSPAASPAPHSPPPPQRNGRFFQQQQQQQPTAAAANKGVFRQPSSVALSLQASQTAAAANRSANPTPINAAQSLSGGGGVSNVRAVGRYASPSVASAKGPTTATASAANRPQPFARVVTMHQPFSRVGTATNSGTASAATGTTFQRLQSQQRGAGAMPATTAARRTLTTSTAAAAPIPPAPTTAAAKSAAAGGVPLSRTASTVTAAAAKRPPTTQPVYGSVLDAARARAMKATSAATPTLSVVAGGPRGGRAGASAPVTTTTTTSAASPIASPSPASPAAASSTIARRGGVPLPPPSIRKK